MQTLSPELQDLQKAQIWAYEGRAKFSIEPSIGPDAQAEFDICKAKGEDFKFSNFALFVQPCYEYQDDWQDQFCGFMEVQVGDYSTYTEAAQTIERFLNLDWDEFMGWWVSR